MAAQKREQQPPSAIKFNAVLPFYCARRMCYIQADPYNQDDLDNFVDIDFGNIERIWKGLKDNADRFVS